MTPTTPTLARCSLCATLIEPGRWMSNRVIHKLVRDEGTLTKRESRELELLCPECALARGRDTSHPWPEAARRCIHCAREAFREDTWHEISDEIVLLGPSGERHVSGTFRLAAFCARCVGKRDMSPLEMPLGEANGGAGIAVEDFVDRELRACRTAVPEPTKPPGTRPKAVVVAGALLAGKTTLRRERFGRGFITLDPADIYVKLTKNEREIPEDFQARLELAGRRLARAALAERMNIVLDLVPWTGEVVSWIVKAFKSRGYQVAIVRVECDLEEEHRRNAARDPHDISCYHTQPMLMRWLFDTLPVGAHRVLDEALAYAVALHGDQPRKASRIPYSMHLMGVVSLVGEAGGSEDELVAAALHDAVEDQGGPRTREEIRARFGMNVAEIVDACSDTDVEPKPPWRERKEAYLARLRDEKHPSALLVSAADKVQNARAILTDLRCHGLSVFERFRAPREDTLWYYRSLVDAYRAARAPERLVGELDLTVSAIEAAVATATRGNPVP